MPENSFKNYPDIKRLIGFIIAPIPSEFIFFFNEHFQKCFFNPFTLVRASAALVPNDAKFRTSKLFLKLMSRVYAGRGRKKAFKFHRMIGGSVTR